MLCAKRDHSKCVILLAGESGMDHQFACQPLFYLKAFSMPGSNTRCAWPKRTEFIIPQTNSVQEQSQWVGTAGEVLRHDSLYKRSDWKASVTGSVDISSERHKLCTLPGSFGFCI